MPCDSARAFFFCESRRPTIVSTRVVSSAACCFDIPPSKPKNSSCSRTGTFD